MLCVRLPKQSEIQKMTPFSHKAEQHMDEGWLKTVNMWSAATHLCYLSVSVKCCCSPKLQTDLNKEWQHGVGWGILILPLSWWLGADELSPCIPRSWWNSHQSFKVKRPTILFLLRDNEIFLPMYYNFWDYPGYHFFSNSLKILFFE